MKKFYTAIIALAATFTATAGDLYLIDNANGSWNLGNGLKGTETSKNVYEFKVNYEKPSYFQFCTDNGNDWGLLGTRYACGESSQDVAIGGTYKVVKGENAFKAPAGELTFTVNLSDSEAMTLYVTGKETEVTYTYTLKGNWDSSSTWTDLDMTEKSTGIWVCNVTVTGEECQFGIMPMVKGSQSGWFACPNSANADITADGGTFELASTDTKNFAIVAGEFLFTLDVTIANNYKLTVTKSSGIEAVSSETLAAPKTYFDLQGRQLKDPKGVVIMRQGTKVEKVVM